MAISVEAQALGHRYVMSRMGGFCYCEGCTTFATVVMTCEFDDEDEEDEN